MQKRWGQKDAKNLSRTWATSKPREERGERSMGDLKVDLRGSTSILVEVWSLLNGGEMKMIAPNRCTVLVSHHPMNLSLSLLVVVIGVEKSFLRDYFSL